VNVVPWRASSLRVFGIAHIERKSWSSVMIVTTLGGELAGFAACAPGASRTQASKAAPTTMNGFLFTPIPFDFLAVSAAK
jgi:hypothetical protein